jgi:RNA polymerase sigma-70 factor (ECF subfamily)
MAPSAAGLAGAGAETEIAGAMVHGDTRRAVTLLLAAYGAEVFGWLVAVHGTVDAADIYGALSLRLVRSMGTFRGESSARTWLYQVARNEARQHLREARKRRAILTPLEHHPSARERVVRGAVSTRDGWLAALRARLSDDDRTLLVLRVDRGLAYGDIARILRPDDEDDANAREAARLRQRLCDIRDRLRRWAREEA